MILFDLGNKMTKKKLEDITKETLNQLYVVEKMSMNKLGKMYDVDRRVIRRKLVGFDIPVVNEGIAFKQDIKEKLKHLTFQLLQELYVFQRKTIAYLSETYKLRKYIVRKTLVGFGFEIRDGCTKENNNTFGKRRSDSTKKNISDANKKFDLTYEELYQYYCVEEKSLTEVGKMFNVNGGSIKDRALNLGIKLRDRKTAMKLAIGGNKHYRWSGGITPIANLIRLSAEYHEWRKACFARDDRTCQICLVKDNNIEFNIDHIISFSSILQKHNIKNMDDARKCQELWDIKNGRALCLKCHKETPSYGVNNKKASNYIPTLKDIISITETIDESQPV